MAPQVPVAEVITRTVAPSAEYTGFLAAPKTVELRSRVGGAVDAVSVPEGSLVRKGQLLFQIDPRPFQVALDTAVAQLRQAEVLAVTTPGQLPSKVRFHFPASMNDPQWQFYAWKDTGYAPFELPAVGQSVHLDAVDLGKMVAGRLKGK